MTANAPTTEVLVIGAGIAGLGVALGLQRRGVRVTVLERGAVASGASWGNAGWVCPAQAGPVPAPGLVGVGARALLRADSALYMAPRELPRMSGWLLEFARRCNAGDHTRGTEALAAIGMPAFSMLEALRAEGLAFEAGTNGLLVVASSEGAVEHFMSDVEPLRRLGAVLPTVIEDGDALRDREPALNERVRAGVHVADHWQVDPAALTRALADHLRTLGVEIETAADVVEVRGGARPFVRTATAEHRADALVLAAGAWTPALSRQLDVRLPVLGGKGYSFYLDLPQRPRHPILFADAHVGAAPIGGSLRVAGTMELSGGDLQIDRRRVEALDAAVRPLLRGAESAPRRNVWAGLRPLAPDGLPVLDTLAPGVFTATGYSMLGMTIGLPAGDLLAEQIVTGRRPQELEPFGADRFGWGLRRRRARARARATRDPSPATRARTP
jgi:D-amino-acid dehydrogenase